MNTYNRAKEIQNVRTQLLPYGEVRRGSFFNAFNCMKAYSFNGERYGYYGYDASGERTYKYDIFSAGSWTNQTGGMDVSLQIDKMMLYPNGYLNMNQNGEYTKHYYADALRIASKIGSGKSGLDLCNEAMAIENAYPGYLTDRINEQYEQMKEELWELVPGSEYIVDITPIPYPNFCDIGPGGQESALFFYHPDHLGSTGMITDNSANITQGFLYTPFGEIISDYSPTFHDSPMPNYAFNAKELDEENGMYYYSARYYAPPTFISRDPMFEKYPSISPYTYCYNNPVLFVDPTGKDGEISINEETKTVVVKANYYYNTSQLENTEAVSLIKSSLDSYSDDIKESFSQQKDFKGYTVDVQFTMINVDVGDAKGKDAIDIIKKAAENDPIGNSITHDPDKSYTATTTNNEHISTNMNTAVHDKAYFFSNSGTMKHELGHTFGLYDRPSGSPNDLMSYDYPRNNAVEPFTRVLNYSGMNTPGTKSVIINKNNREPK